MTMVIPALYHKPTGKQSYENHRYTRAFSTTRWNTLTPFPAPNATNPQIIYYDQSLYWQRPTPKLDASHLPLHSQISTPLGTWIPNPIERPKLLPRHPLRSAPQSSSHSSPLVLPQSLHSPGHRPPAASAPRDESHTHAHSPQAFLPPCPSHPI